MGYTRWLLYESQSLQDQLQWMHDTLLAAEMDNEMVHILSHVPVNTDSCVKAWDREYRRIVVRFAHIIAGQFNGHTHYDEFSIFYSPGGSEALNIAFNGGSGTSFVGLNSNYRIYQADSKNFVSSKSKIEILHSPEERAYSVVSALALSFSLSLSSQFPFTNKILKYP